MGGFLDDVLGFDDDGGIVGSVSDFGAKIDDYVLQPIKGGLQDGLQYIFGIEQPEVPDQFQDRSLLVNRASNVAKIPVIYGTRRAGGTRVFQSVSGANNEYLWLVIVLSEGEIMSIDTVYLDDLPSTDAKFDGTVQITKYVGTDTQTANADLMAAFPGQWTANHRLLGTAYLVVRLTFDSNIYNRVPVITADVRGRKVYDPRDTLTKFSANPALCIHDYLTHARYGKGLSPSLLDTAAFIAAANYCETAIAAYGGGPNINIFECNGVVDTGQDGKRNTEELLTSCRGYLPYTGGKYKLVIDKNETPVMTLNADNIIGAWSIQSGNKRTRINRAKARFTNPGKGWQPDLAITDSAVLRSQDAGLLLEKEIQFPYETNYYRAIYHTEVAMKRARQGLICSFVAAPEALKAEIGDIVAITHATPGWSAKPFRVTNITLRTDGLVAMTCQEHEATAYDRTVPVEAATPPDTNLPDPRSIAAPVALSDYSGTNELIKGIDGTIITRIRCEWPVSPSIYAIGSELEYKLSGSAVWLPAARTASRNDVSAYISPAEDGKLYDLRVRYLNAMGFYSPYYTVTNRLAIGKTEAPPPVTNFLVKRQPDGTREFTWDYLNPPLDHQGFQIRYKLGAGQTWANMSALHGDSLMSSPYETNQLAAGTYTFAIAAIDTSGNLSSPVYIETTLGDPRLAGVIVAEYPRQLNWPGAKTNCWRDPNLNILLARDTKTWADPVPAWASWTSWARTPASPVIYEHPPIDVGISTAFTPFITAIVTGTQTIEISTSTDGVVYSAWAAPSFVTARYIKVRITITGSGLLSISDLIILLSAAVKDETIEDRNTVSLTGGYRIGVGDIRVPITKTYAIIKQVAVTLQNVGPGWSWELIDKAVSPGPRVRIYNASNVLADAMCDFYVKGI